MSESPSVSPETTPGPVGGRASAGAGGSPYRDAFELPASHCYLNTSFMAPLLHAVRRAGEEGLGLRARPWDLSAADFFGPIEELRALAAGLMGGGADDWALTPSVSYGIETAVLNLPIHAGQKVLVVDEQFPSNVYPWRAAAERAGARVEAVARPADDRWAAAIAAAMGSTPPWWPSRPCTGRPGRRIDLVAVSAAAKRAARRWSWTRRRARG